MHHHRVGQQRAQHFELVLPMTRQLFEQGIRLRFAEREILQELKHLTNFIEGQTDDIHEVGDLDDDLPRRQFAAWRKSASANTQTSVEG
jgi:hypothetical protein